MTLTCTSPAAHGIIFRPRFDYGRAAPNLPPDHPNYARARAVVACWVSMFDLDPSRLSRDADFEEWHESAAMLFAAVDSGLPVYAMARSGRGELGGLGVFARFDRNGVHRSQPGEAPLVPPLDLDYILLGNPLVYDPLLDAGYRLVWPVAGADDRANLYFENPAFARHAGRAVALAWSYAGDDDDMNERSDALVPVIQRICRETGGASVALKIVNAPKMAPVLTLPVPDVADDATINQKLFQLYDYGLISMGGGRPRFLVQQTIDMRHEYRIVIVDGEPICGAGCIEASTPLDSDGQYFHFSVEDVRNEGVVTEQPALVALYVDAARAIAADLIAAGAPPHFVLDLAWVPERTPTGEIDEAKGRVVMIEMNPCGAFGLYAMATGRFVEAAVRAAQNIERSDAAPTEPNAEAGLRVRRRCC